MENAFDASWFRGKKITVMGLGRHGGGLGVAKWLVRCGAVVTVTDLAAAEKLAASVRDLDRVADEAGAPVRYVLGRHEEADFIGADMVIRNPAVPQGNRFLKLARAAGVPVESDVTLFFRLCPHPITGVTGTKGKTTVVTLLHAIAKEDDARAVMGGNVRVSPFSWLDRVARARRATPVVMELSSFQLEDLEPLRASPHVGVITNILPDHLNRYDGMEDYARAKMLNVAFQGAGDFAVLNADDPRLVAAAKVGGGRKLWFGLKRPAGADGCFLLGGWLTLWGGGKATRIMPTKEIKMLGGHNLANACAAVAAAWAMGIPVKTIRRAAKKFPGVPGRLERVAVKRGVTYVNDTTATMPDASAAALAALAHGRNVVLIAGGADKELVFGEWAKVVAKKVRRLVLFPGTARAKMDAALAKHAPKVPRDEAANMKEAVLFASAAAQPRKIRSARHGAQRGDVVLLSPACASFGLFEHEFDRGEKFVREVKKL